MAKSEDRFDPGYHPNERSCPAAEAILRAALGGSADSPVSERKNYSKNQTDIRRIN